jgi:hypothetical protein
MENELGGKAYSFPTFYNVILQSIFLAAVTFSPLFMLIGIIYFVFRNINLILSSKTNLTIINLFLLLFLVELLLFNTQAIEYLNKKPQFYYYEFVYISNPVSWKYMQYAKFGSFFIILVVLIKKSFKID